MAASYRIALVFQCDQRKSDSRKVFGICFFTSFIAPHQRQQQSHCRNTHSNCRSPAQRVAHASVDLPLHDRAIVTDLPEYLEWVCHTGERLGESLHAEWSDTSHGSLLIRPKPKHKFRLKSHQERQVPLCSAALHALDAMRQKRSKSSDCIFWQHGGTRNVQNSFSRMIEAASQEMPSLHDITIHTLRKTFASWLVQGGASLQEVKELLGHSTVQITEKHYA